MSSKPSGSGFAVLPGCFPFAHAAAMPSAQAIHALQNQKVAVLQMPQHFLISRAVEFFAGLIITIDILLWDAVRFQRRKLPLNVLLFG